MKKLLFITFTSGLLLTSSAIAWKNEQKHLDVKEKIKNMSFEDAQTFLLNKIDNKITKIKTIRECFANAKSKIELKECKPQRRSKN